MAVNNGTMLVNISDVLVFISVLSILCYWYLKRSLGYWQRHGVPVISPSMPFGNFGPIFRHHKSIGDHLQDLYNATNERFIGMYAMFTPMFLLCDPQLIRIAMIRDFDHFHDRTTQIDGKTEPLLLHLISLHGEQWKKCATC